jgi:hypothetical protein
MGRPGAAEIVRRSATARISVAYIRRDNVSVETHTRECLIQQKGCVRTNGTPVPNGAQK